MDTMVGLWLIEEFGPKFQYLPGEENPVADALSRLDKEQSSTEEYNNPATCFATLDCDYFNPFREEDKEHLAENVFSGTEKEQDMIFLLSATSYTRGSVQRQQPFKQVEK